MLSSIGNYSCLMHTRYHNILLHTLLYNTLLFITFLWIYYFYSLNNLNKALPRQNSWQADETGFICNLWSVLHIQNHLLWVFFFFKSCKTVVREITKMNTGHSSCLYAQFASYLNVESTFTSPGKSFLHHTHPANLSCFLLMGLSAYLFTLDGSKYGHFLKYRQSLDTLPSVWPMCSVSGHVRE